MSCKAVEEKMEKMCNIPEMIEESEGVLDEQKLEKEEVEEVEDVPKDVPNEVKKDN